MQSGNRPYLSLAVAVFTLLLSFACEKQQNGIVTPNALGNLISNSSFEQGDSASLYGWHRLIPPSIPESLAIKFLGDTPPGGGEFSVAVKNDWANDAGVYTYIPLPEGRHIYEFSVWAKFDTTDWGPAWIRYYVRDVSGYWNSTSIAVQDTVWTQYTLRDTLDSSETDIALIYLRGSPYQFTRNYTLYDLCTFTVVQ